MNRKPDGSPVLYLASAALVLLGGYIQLYGGRVPKSALSAGALFLSYEALLVVAIGYLHHLRSGSKDPVVLLGVLVPFLLDLPLVQQRFGWERGGGRLAADLGFVGTAAIVVALGVLLRIRLATPMFGTLLAASAFLHYAPSLLVGAAPPPFGLAPESVLLGWLLAAVLLPALLLPHAADGRSELPVGLLEERIVGASICAAFLHFLLAGIGFSVPFRAAALAPFLILLSPLLERSIPREQETGPRRIVLHALPYLGLAVSAFDISPALYRPWPNTPATLTPWSLALPLAILVIFRRARRTGSIVEAHAVALLLAAAVLTRNLDLPELLASLRHPAAWQAIGAGTICWSAILHFRNVAAGLPLAALSAVLFAAPLADAGESWPVAAAFVGAAHLVAFRLATRSRAERPERIAVAAAATVLPLVPLAVVREPGIELAVFCSGILFAALVGRWTADRLLRLAALAVPLAAGGIALVSRIRIHPGPIGPLLVRLGFLVLVLGVLRALFGARLAPGIERLRRAIEALRGRGRIARSAVEGR